VTSTLGHWRRVGKGRVTSRDALALAKKAVKQAKTDSVYPCLYVPAYVCARLAAWSVCFGGL
jgi:hypothetical protein